MKIIKLKSENVKRIQAIEIKPDGNFVVVSGKNDQGKSSILDSIVYAIGGSRNLPPEPIRKGQKKAVVEIEFEDLKIRWVCTQSGQTLSVGNKEGLKYDSPQKVLDAFYSKLTFDPLEFSRLGDTDPTKQAEMLKKLVGLDFSKQDSEISRLYESRKDVNREVKQLAARLEPLPPVVISFDDDFSTDDVLKRQTEAINTNRANDVIRREATDAESKLETANKEKSSQQKRCNELKEQIVGLQARLELETKLLVSFSEKIADLQADAKSKREKILELKDIDLSDFQEQLKKVEQNNERIRQNKQRKELDEQYKLKTNESEDYTKKIEELQNFKQEAIIKASFPVPGLGFSSEGFVTFNELPFNQASTSVKLKTSIAVGIALNPKMKVLLVRNGNDLDEENMKLVADIAEKHDIQIWIERCGSNNDVGFVIEDGLVKEVKSKQVKNFDGE